MTHCQASERELSPSVRARGDRERNVIKAAIKKGYYAENTDDAAYQSILTRFRRHTAIREHEYSGEWLVRYNGTMYWAELRYSQFVEEE